MQRIELDALVDRYKTENILLEANRGDLIKIAEQAAERGREDIIDWLFNTAQAEGFDTSIFSVSCMDYAVRGGHLELVKKLYQRRPSDINIEADDASNLFHDAALKNHLPILRWMHAQDFDVKSKSKKGYDAMYYAISANADLETVQFLHEIGLDIYQTVDIRHPFIRSNCTMMHIAMLNRAHGEEIAKWLYMQNVSVLKRTDSRHLPSDIAGYQATFACKTWIETMESICSFYEYLSLDHLQRLDLSINGVFANDLLLAVRGEHPFMNDDKLQKILRMLISTNHYHQSKYCLEFAKFFFHFYRVIDATNDNQAARTNLLKIAVVLAFVGGDDGIFSMDCVYGIRALTGQKGLWVRSVVDVTKEHCQQWYMNFARDNTAIMFHCINDLFSCYKSILDRELNFTDQHPFAGMLNHLYKIQSMHYAGFFTQTQAVESTPKRRALSRSVE